MKRYLKVKAPGYNLIFDRKTGFLARWGNTKEENPVFSPVGPEIADIEISTICHGIGKSMESRVPCVWCYKTNTGDGQNMSFETFRDIFGKFPRTLTQIAFGIGDIDGNPDLWRIMELCRANGVIPNVTVNGMCIDSEIAARLAGLCGAVAVSHYGDNLCFKAVEVLSQAGLKQVNIHKLLAKETYESCFRLIDQVKSDSRLAGLKAIVFLLLKPKGDRNQMHSIEDVAAYRKLLDYGKTKGIGIGMDSCSAPMVFKSINTELISSVEPCESTLFSIYVNVNGEVFPCSFTEGTIGWKNGIDLIAAGDFLKDVWYHPRVVEWRNKLIATSADCDCVMKLECRSCPIYDITLCKPQLVKIANA